MATSVLTDPLQKWLVLFTHSHQIVVLSVLFLVYI